MYFFYSVFYTGPFLGPSFSVRPDVVYHMYRQLACWLAWKTTFVSDVELFEVQLLALLADASVASPSAHTDWSLPPFVATVGSECQVNA